MEDLINMLKKEGGVVGKKSWLENPFGPAAKAFDDAQDDIEEHEKKIRELREDAQLEKQEH